MKGVNNMFNGIILTGIRKKKNIKIRCTKRMLDYLNLLVTLNLVEYVKDPVQPNVYTIYISYYNSKSILKKIKYIGNLRKGSISNKKWLRELSSRKALYIAETTAGLRVLDGSLDYLTPLRLVYKISIN
jgi:hypothetical protein